MKKLIFTSNTKHYHKIDNQKLSNEIDNTNGIVDQIKKIIADQDTILYIAANPDDIDKVNSYSKLIFEGFEKSGIVFDNYLILDNRTFNLAEDYIKKANLIFLGGGDTFIQNEFFKKINLKQLLTNHNAVIVGQSAGSINMANQVYNSPEYGEESDNIYFDGLGLSNINIEPHFEIDSSNFDDNQIYQRNHILSESFKRPIYALCDGSHILEIDDEITVYGESFLIKDGLINKVCEENNFKKISPITILKK